jgi:hypothetical protein
MKRMIFRRVMQEIRAPTLRSERLPRSKALNWVPGRELPAKTKDRI